MTLYGLWSFKEDYEPLFIVCNQYDHNFDNAFVWEGTAEELYFEFGDSLHDYKIVKIEDNTIFVET